MNLKEMSLGPDEIINTQEELDPKIYFIQKGEIQFFIENENQDSMDKDIIKLGSLFHGNFFN